jgi:hypothetical protein
MQFFVIDFPMTLLLHSKCITLSRKDEIGVSNETNILEQIATARRIGELWLRHAEQYLRKYRSDYEARLQSRYDAIEADEVLDFFCDAGHACFEDLDGLLKAASQLSPSQLRKLEPKWSRAKPILSRAGAVLDQIGAVHKEISCDIASLGAEDNTARARRNGLGAIGISITVGELFPGLLFTSLSPLFWLVLGANLVPLALFVLPGLFRWLEHSNEDGLSYNVGKETEIRAIRIVKRAVSPRRVDARKELKVYYRAMRQLLEDPFSESEKGQHPKKNGNTLKEIAKRSLCGEHKMIPRVAGRIGQTLKKHRYRG